MLTGDIIGHCELNFKMLYQGCQEYSLVQMNLEIKEWEVLS